MSLRTVCDQPSSCPPEYTKKFNSYKISLKIYITVVRNKKTYIFWPVFTVNFIIFFSFWASGGQLHLKRQQITSQLTTRDISMPYLLAGHCGYIWHDDFVHERAETKTEVLRDVRHLSRWTTKTVCLGQNNWSSVSQALAHFFSAPLQNFYSKKHAHNIFKKVSEKQKIHFFGLRKMFFINSLCSFYVCILRP